MAGGAARDAGELGAAVGGGAARPGRRHGDDVGHRPTARRPAGAGSPSMRRGRCCCWTATTTWSSSSRPILRSTSWPSRRRRRFYRRPGPYQGRGARRKHGPVFRLAEPSTHGCERPHPVRRRCRPRGGAPGRVARPAHPTLAPHVELSVIRVCPARLPRRASLRSRCGWSGGADAALRQAAPGARFVRRASPSSTCSASSRATWAGRPSIPAPRRRPTAGGGCWRRGSAGVVGARGGGGAAAALGTRGPALPLPAGCAAFGGLLLALGPQPKPPDRAESRPAAKPDSARPRAPVLRGPPRAAEPSSPCRSSTAPPALGGPPCPN